MFPPWLRIQTFLPWWWKSLHKVHGKGKRDFLSSVGISGHSPTGHLLLCFNTLNLIVHLLKQSWPKLPKPSWVCTSPMKSQCTLPKIQHSRKCTRFFLSQHSKNGLVDILGREQGVEPGTQKDSWHFSFEIILLFVTTLNLFDLHFTQNVYNMWTNLVIYIFQTSLLSHRDSFKIFLLLTVKIPAPSICTRLQNGIAGRS